MAQEVIHQNLLYNDGEIFTDEDFRDLTEMKMQSSDKKKNRETLPEMVLTTKILHVKKKMIQILNETWKLKNQ